MKKNDMAPSLCEIMQYLNPLLCNVVNWSDTLQKSCSICCKIFKVCLTILRHCEVKGLRWKCVGVSVYVVVYIIYLIYFILYIILYFILYYIIFYIFYV